MPGLILEAYDSERKFQYLFRSLELYENETNENLKKPVIGTVVEPNKFYDYLQDSEEKFINELMTKATNRGSSITMSLGKIFRKELNFDDLK